MRNLIKVVGVRVTADLYTKIKLVSSSRGEDVSDFVRRSILKELATLSFVSIEQKKALGLKEVEAIAKD